MSIYVYITKDCQEDIKGHSLSKQVNSFKEKIEETQRITYFDRFPPPYLKKRFSRQERLIAAEKFFDDDIVICFYRLLIRGGREYREFVDSPKEYGDRCFAPLASDDELKEFLEIRSKENLESTREKPTEEEHTFIWGVLNKDDFFSNDVVVYESHDWINSIKKSEINNRLFPINDALQKILDNNEDNNTVRQINGFSIIYKYDQVGKKLFLGGIEKNNNTNVIIEKYSKILQSSDDITEIDVIRNSGKSYPSIVLIDIDSWIGIEKNSDSNLALSPEESELLKSVMQNTTDKKQKSGFPLFINGRAGSGKSTILQYIFADYYRFYISESFTTVPPPLFLTYSKELVDKSERIINNLINYNFKSADEDTSKISLENNKIIDDFLNFTYNKLSLSDQEKQFKRENYIDYPKFTKLWQGQFANDPNALKKYGPDISWHVIRSYIKGLSIDGYLDLEEYNELPKNERNVTESTFELVFNKVWNNWYKPLCEENDGNRFFWDSQDLVRYLLDNELIQPKASAVFCDEAQDFTRIELELLLRLSIFYNKAIDSETLNRIPFAFAGDPFQTLNPTGFRWEAIKSSFVEKFIFSLTPELRFGHTDLNYKELTFNYRSSINIVKFCNTIQLLRSVLFEYSSLEPQETWSVEEKPTMPLLYKMNDPSVKENLSKQSELRIIVPCKEGEESNFVNNDGFLKDVVELDDKGVPENVLSPMRAKGLEFSRVVLYGFGKYSNSLFDLKTKNIEQLKNVNIDDKISLEYFINQIYVGASRAQKKLFIVDSQDGIESLWKFANDQSLTDKLLAIVNNRDRWEEGIGGLILGSDNSWSEEMEDLMDVARQMEEEGKAKMDPFFLRQAAMSYKSANNNNKSSECKALALGIEGDYIKSGKLYIECGKNEEALKSYWKANAHKEIVELGNTDSNLSKRFEVRISATVIKPKGFSSILPLLNDLVEQLEIDTFKSKIIGDKNWSHSIIKLFENNANKALNKEFSDWESLFYAIQKLNNIIPVPAIHFAEIAFNASKYGEAVELYDKAGLKHNDNFLIAKNKHFISKYKDNELEITNENIDVIFNFLLDEGKTKEAFNEIIKIYDAGIFRDLLNKSHENIEEIAEILIENYIEKLEFNKKWEELVNILSKGWFLNEYLDEYIGTHKKIVLSQIVKTLASSALLPDASNKSKEIISNFLRDHFIKKNIDSWKNYLRSEVVGAAMERAGRDIDCLKFYEKIADSSEFEEASIQNSKIRWVKVKLRQAQREASINLDKKAEEHKREAELKLKSLNIKIDREPEFPQISGLLNKQQIKEEKIPVEEIDSKVENDLKSFKSKIGSFELNVNRSKRRINIEHIEESTLASIFSSTKTCSSQDVQFIENDGIIEIPKWNLTIEFAEGSCIIKETKLNAHILIQDI